MSWPMSLNPTVRRQACGAHEPSSGMPNLLKARQAPKRASTSAPAQSALDLGAQPAPRTSERNLRGATRPASPRTTACIYAPRTKTSIQPASALHLPSALRRASAAAAAPYAHPSSASLRPSLVCRLDSSTAQERPRPSTAQERPRLHYRLLTLCPADPIPCAESIYAHSCRSRR